MRQNSDSPPRVFWRIRVSHPRFQTRGGQCHRAWNPSRGERTRGGRHRHSCQRCLGAGSRAFGGCQDRACWNGHTQVGGGKNMLRHKHVERGAAFFKQHPV
ncbi:unnamed protein product [Acanthoscelides obtectus]|uniref:Uncharacterized protein n=1 Tax=Acanthoscelides obtectus TaxID=200917 RepID=A0A9P0PFQ0_ACAOB|nr:unnamed protein product [Acanthoscelides obtectus]CAK1674969.1 hypothetical protein AOBTE_LOCUS29836 [Acanthoscelides obtectus]